MDSKLEKIRELNQQAWAVCKKDSTTALRLAGQAQKLLSQYPNAPPQDQFECLKTQTYCLDMLNQSGQALQLGLQAKELAEQIGDTYAIGSIQSLLGRIYWHIDDFPTAMHYYLNALNLVQNTNHPDLEISLMNGLGLVQYGLENYAEALGYFRACLEKAGQADFTGRADASNNIAFVLYLLKRHEEALVYGMNALSLFTQLGTAVGRMETLHTLGAIHVALGNYDQATSFLEQGIQIAREYHSPLLEITCILDTSRIHQRRGELDRAEGDLLGALDTAEKINSLTNSLLIHERLADLYKEKKDYAAALAHFESFHAASKKISNIKTDRRIKNLEITHAVETSRKQADLYRELAETDSLTGLVSRRHFLEIAEHALQQSKTDQSRLAIVMLDIDHFKNVNDTHGHQVGDDVLSVIGSRLKESLRKGDVAGRYGGEEFVTLVVGASSEQCLKIAERMRQGIARQEIQTAKVNLSLTISLGVAYIHPDRALSLDAWINCADRALYQAKDQGRNRVVVWTTEESGMEATL